VPTLAEAAGLPGYDIGAWIGYTAPPGTPKEILMRLSGEIQKAVQSPELKEKYLALGLEPVATTPEEMATFMRSQYERYGSVIRSANIKIEP
jgi:tripartite-type tricarboxylate transporter receptor subunit TctC